ncbi:MAG: choice-of-anchor J domain-containing protein, partial [Bacteroidota bacterium]|nr:choice-of-anchor J domain-containing protein [Bacteroidota bacterium]
FQVDLYNGNNGAVYDTRTLNNYTPGITSGNFSIYFFNYTNAGGSIQNGSPDGMALSYNGELIPGQFLSYEGTLLAVDGPATGLTSEDIGVSESSSTPAGESLQLTGTGTQYIEFAWTDPAPATPGQLNNDQTLGGSLLPEPTNYPTDFASGLEGVSVTLTWTDATGAQLPSAYIVLASDEDNIVAPVDGIPIANDPDISDGQAALNVSYGDEECSFSSLMGNKTYYFEIYPYTNAGTNVDYKNDGTAPATTTTTPYVILFQDFNNNWGFWDTVNVIGNEVWDRDNTFGINGTACAAMSGFSGGPLDNEDWLISSAMNLDAYTNEVLTFFSAMNYTGPDLELVISTDYDGGGDPSTATWTDLTWNMSPGSWEWTSSGDIDLSAVNGTAVYLAFKYTSTTAGSATWELDDVLVTGEPAVGIEPLDGPEQSISIFPNPSDGMVQIESMRSEQANIEIYTSAGKRVFLLEKAGIPRMLNLNSLESGVYFIRIYNDQEMKTIQRLVIY